MVLLPLLLRLLLAPASAAAPASPWGPEPAPVGWSATDAVWRLRIRDGEPIQVEADYAMASPDARAEVLTLVGPQLLLTEATGPVVATPKGLQVALGPERRQQTQHLEGLLPESGKGRLELPILPAARTRVVVDAPGLDVTVDGAVDGWIGPRDQLRVSWRPHVAGEAVHEGLLVQGEAATVFRGEGGSLLVEGTLRWRVVRGEARRLSFDAAGLDELEVAGPGVARWRREGSQVVIEPKAPVKGLFAVTLRGRASLGKGERAVPSPQPSAVQRVERYVTMARSDEGELIPVAMPTSVPLAQLPAWARNLGDGVPLAAWRGPQPLRVLNGGFESLQGPDTVVTQARYTVAAAREGRLALRMNLRVRNERRQYLHVAATPGWRPVVVRVGNQPVSGLGDGAGGLYIPLEKSIETVKGLLSFPVDVEWIATDLPAWDRRGEMELQVPAIDAPIQAAAWEVHLPRGYRALRAPTSGSGTVMLGDLRGGDELEDDSGMAEEERRKQEVVSSALQNAVTAYRSNDWSTAQRWLDEAKTVDADNEDAQLLQENLDVLEGRSTRNDVGARRVKDLARARSSGLESQQAEVEKSADYLYRSGDLDAAEAAWEQALQVAQELRKVEQLENAEQSVRISQASSKLAEIRDQKQKRASEPSGSASSRPASSSRGASSWSAGADRAPTAPPAPDPAPVEEEAEGTGGAPGLAVLGSADAPLADGNLGDDDDQGSFGTGGLGLSGVGMGGGGSAEGLGGLGTKGTGSGRGYGAGATGEAPPAEPVTVEAEASEVVLDKEFLDRIPTGRAYGGKTGEARKEAAPEADEREESVVVAKKKTHARAAAAPAKPAAAKATAAPAPAPAQAPALAPPPPAPPPPPPVTTATAIGGRVAPKLARKLDAEEQRQAPGPAPVEVAAPAARDEADDWAEDKPAPRPDTSRSGALRELADAPAAGPAAGELAAAPDRGTPPPIPRPRPPPERRKPLEVSASPMALALPLDGPTVTTTQALLPAGELPTFRFRYRQLPSENDR